MYTNSTILFVNEFADISEICRLWAILYLILEPFVKNKLFNVLSSKLIKGNLLSKHVERTA